jgi:hypothetical protein
MSVPSFRVVCDRDMEGIVAKQASARYTPEATTWVKIKNRQYSQAIGARIFSTAGASPNNQRGYNDAGLRPCRAGRWGDPSHQPIPRSGARRVTHYKPNRSMRAKEEAPDPGHLALSPKNRRWLTLVGKRKPAPHALDN